MESFDAQGASEYQENIFSPDTIAQPDYSPFYKPNDIDIEGVKFVQLDSEELQRLSQESGLELTEEQKQNGVILIDSMPAMESNHMDLIKNAFNLLDVEGIYVENAGTIMNPKGDPNEIYVTQYSAFLPTKNKRGEIVEHKDMKVRDMMDKHAKTAGDLKRVYGEQFTFVPKDLMS